MKRLLEVKDLCKSFGTFKALDHVSFRLIKGELLAMIGPNGAGKSTCFNLINGQLKPDKGKIYILGSDTTGKSPREIWKMGVGRTFQIASPFYSMSVLENVQMVLISHGGRIRSIHRHFKGQFYNEAMELLRAVGLEDKFHKRCGILTYGDLKRVEFAMALASNPRLLLMDEPTAGMEMDEKMKLMELIERTVKDRSIGLLFTEHDMDVVFSHADRVIMLNNGRVISEGDPQEVKRDEEVKRIYLGSYN
ncbi:MAG TPA: ABC transporter ATP-binding protein [Desulfobacteraceae bacterium]|nr:ABC transporter ATP-binding protein [Desulfobacteraceae bacterium]